MTKGYSDYMQTHRSKKKPRFPDYTGGKMYRVNHPDYGDLEVIAPSIPAAIATAAGVWERRWQEYEFYANCSVVPCGTDKGEAKK